MYIGSSFAYTARRSGLATARSTAHGFSPVMVCLSQPFHYTDLHIQMQKPGVTQDSGGV
jgi:hypothetical protein